MDNDLKHYRLEGAVALVTGASSGLGRHFATTLARAGAIVGIAARREDRLQRLADEIGDTGGRAIALKMDVTRQDQVDAGLDRLETEIGPVTVLVNNAGVVAGSAFLDTTAEEYDRSMDLNQRAVWLVQQSVCRRMVAAGLGGSVVNISSITGLRCAGGAAAYAISKAAVAHMTRITAMELARRGIRVNALAPGYFPTEMTEGFLASEAGQNLKRRIPMRRVGELHELDGPLLLLASPLGSFITGTVLPVDGGHLVTGL